MKILLVNYRYFISGGPEKYMFNIKKMLEDNGHEVIPFSIHSNKNVKTKYSKYFVEPIGGRDATYFDEVKKHLNLFGRCLHEVFIHLRLKVQ